MTNVKTIKTQDLADIFDMHVFTIDNNIIKFKTNKLIQGELVFNGLTSDLPYYELTKDNAIKFYAHLSLDKALSPTILIKLLNYFA